MNRLLAPLLQFDNHPLVRGGVNGDSTEWEQTSKAKKQKLGSLNFPSVIK